MAKVLAKGFIPRRMQSSQLSYRCRYRAGGSVNQTQFTACRPLSVNTAKKPELSCKIWAIGQSRVSSGWFNDYANNDAVLGISLRGQRRLFSDYGYRPNESLTEDTSQSSSPDNFQDGNRKIIARLLDLEETDVMKVPKKEVNENKASRTLEVLKKFHYTSSSARLFPDLLIMNPGAVENYIRIMQESCFVCAREMFILRFRTVGKQPISVLQRKMLIPSVDTILDQYCKELEEVDPIELRKSLPDNIEQMSVFDLRHLVMSFYFKHLSLCTEKEERAPFQKYPRLYYRSFNWVKRAYRILKELEFSDEKIKRNFYLLTGDPDNLVKVLEIKSLGGMEIKKLCHSRPKVLMSSDDTLLSIEKSLIEHGIAFSSTQKYPEVFTLAALTVQRRLQEMDKIPEFQLLKMHPRAARLLYYYNKAKSRLEEFRTMHVRVPSLHLLSADDKRLSKSISTGDIRIRGVDAMIYLSDTLKVKRKTIRENICCHPHWLHIPLVNVKSVLQYIQGFSCFSDKQIIEAVPILLHPKSKVEKEIDNVLKSGEASMSDEYFLQMVLYFLERPVHFTGDAVWHDKIVHDDEDAENLKQS